MTNTTPPSNTMPPSPAAADPPLALTRAEFAQLLARLDMIERRGVRTETKVMRLLERHGLDGHGQPLSLLPEETG